MKDGEVPKNSKTKAKVLRMYFFGDFGSPLKRQQAVEVKQTIFIYFLGIPEQLVNMKPEK